MTNEAILTLNAGSSSIKFALFSPGSDTPSVGGQIDSLGRELGSEGGGGPRLRAQRAGVALEAPPPWDAQRPPRDHAQALRALVPWLTAQTHGLEVVGVGHRVVHGGMTHVAPVRVTDGVLDDLRRLVPMAPLHQPHNIAGIEAAREAFGGVPQVACFDTAFHRAQPFVNDCFALPRALYERGVRRYGFHGLSYEFIAGRLRELYPLHAAGRVVVAHLGNGASMCAMRDGASVASTMGFSALDGLPMGTRCGQVDPGVLLHLLQHEGMSAGALSDMLYRDSGLKGLSGGLSNDMRTLEASAAPEAGDAIDYFVLRVRRELGGLAAALEGLDAVVFTGGIGENSARVRQRVLEGMEWIGLELDQARNRANDRVISSARSRALALVLPTDEESMIARHVSRLLSLLVDPGSAHP